MSINFWAKYRRFIKIYVNDDACVFSMYEDDFFVKNIMVQ